MVLYNHTHIHAFFILHCEIFTPPYKRTHWSKAVIESVSGHIIKTLNYNGRRKKTFPVILKSKFPWAPSQGLSNQPSVWSRGNFAHVRTPAPLCLESGN